MGYIIKQIKMPCGLEVENAYFKLNRLSYDDGAKTLYFAGEFYINKQLREEGYQPIESAVLCEVLTLPDKTVNLYEYVYEYIKEKAIEVSKYSEEEIDNLNSEVLALHTGDGPALNMINKNYALFIDAESD